MKTEISPIDLYIVTFLFWLLLIALPGRWARLPFGRWITPSVIIIGILGAAEFGAVLAFRISQSGSAADMNQGQWLWNSFNPNATLFERHPYLVAQGRPSIQLTEFGNTISHNSLGFRGPEIDNNKTKLRVAAIGGSTTYGVGVNNEQTWPAQLQLLLGNHFEVLNLGIPAHSTVEHINLAAFYLPELSPDIVLIHAGLNDLHIAGTPALAPDYHNAHAPMIIGNLGFCPTNTLPRYGTIRMLWQLFEHLGLYPSCEINNLRRAQTPIKTPDLSALALFVRNLKNLIVLCQRTGAKVILIPQVFSEEKLADGGYKWWTPNIDQSALPDIMRTYNEALRQVGQEMGVPTVGSVSQQIWGKTQFADHSHLNAEGNTKFAELIAPAVKDLSPAAPNRSLSLNQTAE